MSLLLLVVAVTVAAVAVAAIGVVSFRRRDEDPWHNAELFLPHDRDVPLGGSITARYRSRPREAGTARGAEISAELQCHERVDGQRVGAPVAVVPVEVANHSTDDLLEADLVVRVPSTGVPASFDSSGASLEWVLRVQVDSPGGSPAEAVRPLRVAARVAP